MPEVCVVVPCFNEERRLRGAEILEFLDTHPDTSVCLVDDGSVDQTYAVLQRLQARRAGQIMVWRLEHNCGKAEAVRLGVLHVASLVRFQFIGYWDADLSTPLDELDHLLEVLRATPECQLTLGSRVKRLGSHIERRTLRHVLGRVFAACATGVLGLSVYDSQCGAKLFRASAVDILFGEPFVTRWLFDLEMLVRLRNSLGLRLETTMEVPLRRWAEVGGSKLTPLHMIRVPFELLKIRAKYDKGE